MAREPLMQMTRTTMQGPRLLLRPFRLADAPAILGAVDSCRWRVRETVPWSKTVHTLAQMRRRIRGIHTESRRREMKRCVMVERATGAVIGTVMLGLGRRKQGNAMLGYWMRADRWGRGYGTESTILLARFAVERIGSTRLEFFIDPRNKRSRRIPDRLGIAIEGYDDYFWRDENKWVKSVVYVASAADVRRLKTKWNARLRDYRSRV